MGRRKRLTPRQRLALRYKQNAAISIGETRQQQKARADAHENAVIQATHDAVWLRHGCCQLCRGLRSRECRARRDQMHEDPPRAATRGLPPAQRFNVRVCGRLCWICHRDVTEKRLRICFADPVQRFLGPVWAEPVDDVGDEGGGDGETEAVG